MPVKECVNRNCKNTFHVERHLSHEHRLCDECITKSHEKTITVMKGIMDCAERKDTTGDDYVKMLQEAKDDLAQYCSDYPGFNEISNMLINEFKYRVQQKQQLQQ